MPASVPARLGRYEVIKRIGKGSMGVVYLARDPVIRRMVALKTFRMDFAGSDREVEQFRARFMREAQSAGILSHTNIVTIHDVVEDVENDLAFIAMEYVRGTNLKELIEGGEKFSFDRIAELVSQIAAALDYAHGKGVVHRDIKPANVILDAEGTAKVTDFGIARLESSNLTQEGQLLGTPNYMSPEQVLSQPLDHRTDIFSLGIVIYELITARKPFQGSNFTSVSHKIVYEDYADPEEYVPGFPAELRSVLDRALAKSPDDRFSQAGELADDFLITARLLHDPIARRTGAFVAVAAEEPEQPEQPHPPLQPERESAPPPPRREPRPPSEPVVVVTRERADRAEQLRGLTETAWRMASAGRERLAPVATRRLGVTLLAVGLAGLIAWGLVSELADKPPPEIRMGAQIEARAAVLPQLREARLALERGDPSAAAAALREVEGTVADERPGVQSLRAEVETQLQELEQIQHDATRIEEGLVLARSEMEAGNFEEAWTQATDVLELDPDQFEALSLQEEAEAALSQETPAPSKPRSASRRTGTRRVPESEPRASPAKPRAPAVAPVRLTVQLHSELAEGVLAIYFGKLQILRESFRFEKTGVLRRAAGTLERALEIEPGSGALRVHVSGIGSSPSTAVEKGTFESGTERRLTIRLSRSGDLETGLE